MKQNMKRLWLMVCMALCLGILSGCSAEQTEKTVEDAELYGFLCNAAEETLKTFVAVPEDQIDTVVEALLKSRDSVTASGLTGWQGVMKDTGAFVDVLASRAVENEDGTYEAIVDASFANRKVEFKVFFEQNDQGLAITSYSFSPEYTTGEKLTKAAMNTAMGMGTVFLVLIFISVLISCFKYINAFENKAKAAAAPAPAAVAPAPVTAQAEEELVDDLELVAVITAAIAAYDNTSADGLVVRSIKRASGAKWKRA